MKNLKILTWLLIIIILLGFNISGAAAYTNVSFFVVAHQDDWQLFMGDIAYNNIQNPENKVVIIYTTAGDAGLNTPPFAYVSARQQGAINSVLYAANANNINYSPPEKGNRTLNSKQVEYFSYKNTISYFLRLPDGDIGQPGLTALYNNAGASYTLTSPTTMYSGWSELVNTIKAIYIYESSGISNSWLNCAETNQGINPDDHNDHIKTSLAAQEAAANLICNKNLYIEYYCAQLNSNISTDGLINKSALLAEYCSAMNQAGFYTNSWDSYHKSFLDKTYFRSLSCSNNVPEIILEQNYPNPFSNNTRIIFEIPKGGFVTITLYASTGQVVKTINQMKLPAGRQSLYLNNSELPGPGIYFCVLEAFGKTEAIKLIYN